MGERRAANCISRSGQLYSCVKIFLARVAVGIVGTGGKITSEAARRMGRAAVKSQRCSPFSARLRRL